MKNSKRHEEKLALFNKPYVLSRNEEIEIKRNKKGFRIENKSKH